MHNENSRVKIPATAHLVRMGYSYLSIKENHNIDKKTNIFIDIFKKSLEKINRRELTDEEVVNELNNIHRLLLNDDLGKSFYEYLLGLRDSKVGKIIDFKNIKNNSFHVINELEFSSDYESFYPDVTIVINGIPLSFVEVKKPNNPGGIQEEFNRNKRRMENKNFKKFFNMFQLLLFTNNMDYNVSDEIKTQGSFYTTPNGLKTSYQYFREEKSEELLSKLSELPSDVEMKIVLDNNAGLDVLKDPSYHTNSSPNTYTNSFLSSLLDKERFMFILRYGLVFVNKKGVHDKHIIRYPQLFAIESLNAKIKSNEGFKRGIVWHTQGSGKTALTYHAVRFLQKELTSTPQCYFIVDRLDLLNQACNEFKARGLQVDTVNSREEFKNHIKKPTTADITVVNIHKFSEESVVSSLDCELGIQRVYFIDEAHRSYNPKGSFLKNLSDSDKNAMIIGLTGTPLLKRGRATKEIFGEYIHKYFYNKSIADGYTLRIKKEKIETEYQNKLRDIMLKYADVNVKKGSFKEDQILEDHSFCSCLAEYIYEDFKKFRFLNGDDSSLGAMIVAKSSNQARQLYSLLSKTELKVALVLCDEENNMDKQEGFKNGEYDVLIVFNMLLTGYDAPRLKKLYLARLVKDHNLLQTITRVNRPFNDYRYGYIVDFVDIQEAYDETLAKYIEELRLDLVDDDAESIDISDLFVDIEQIKEEFNNVMESVSEYDLSNLEVFQESLYSLTPEEIKDVHENLKKYDFLRKELKMSYEKEFLDKHDISDLPASKVKEAIGVVRDKINFDNFTSNPSGNISEKILESIKKGLLYRFFKTSEDELVLDFCDELFNRITKVREELEKNKDKNDPEFVTLNQEFKELMGKLHFSESSLDEFEEDIANILNKVKVLNYDNSELMKLFNDDEGAMRIYKSLVNKNKSLAAKTKLFLCNIKDDVYEKISHKKALLENEGIISKMIRNSLKSSIKEISKSEQDLFIHIFKEELYNANYLKEV